MASSRSILPITLLALTMACSTWMQVGTAAIHDCKYDSITKTCSTSKGPSIDSSPNMRKIEIPMGTTQQTTGSALELQMKNKSQGELEASRKALNAPIQQKYQACFSKCTIEKKHIINQCLSSCAHKSNEHHCKFLCLTVDCHKQCNPK